MMTTLEKMVAHIKDGTLADYVTTGKVYSEDGRHFAYDAGTGELWEMTLKGTDSINQKILDAPVVVWPPKSMIHKKL